jgi:macrolide-specific efflux system membrane fusion protein
MLDDLVRKDRGASHAPIPSAQTSHRFGAVGAAARRRPWLSAAIAIAVLALAAYTMFGGHGGAAGKPLIATVTRGDIEDDVTALGNLQPSNYIDVGAQASGQLKKLYVGIGDHVDEGQLLAEIDPAVQAAKVEADNAQLNNLQAQLLDKQSTAALNAANAARQERLKAENATSQSDYDSAQAAMRSAAAQAKAVAAQITQAQSTLKADTATLGYTKIYAPMSGSVASITTKQGMTVNANQVAPVILQVADLTVMTVQTQVSEADVPKLHVGMDAYFTTLGSDRRWYGKLKQIWPTPTVVNNVVLYTALFDVQNPDSTLMMQMTAQVFFVVAQAHDVLIVPAAAVHPKGGADSQTATVTVIKDDGTQEVRNVTTGVTDRVSTEIRSGLSQGEKVVAGLTLDESAKAKTPAQNNRNRMGGPGGGFGAP